jgi:hypothetical protein
VKPLRVENPLIRAYYTSWTLSVLFGINGIAAIIVGIIEHPNQAELSAFGGLSLLAMACLLKIGYYLHHVVNERTPRH